MVKKVIRIGTHEILTVDITCLSCKTKVQYKLDDNLNVRRRCLNCEAEYPEEIYKGMGSLKYAFQNLRETKKCIIEFEVELKEN